VYEVHDYTPTELTSNSSLTYPGTATEWYGTCTFNKEAFQGIAQAGDPAECATNTNLYTVYGLDWGVSNSVPMYIGEWGATSSLTGYAQLMQDKAELYNTWGVSSANYSWKHNTIVTGGSNQWGIYSVPLRLDDPTKLAAVQVSWLGAIFPSFTSASVENTSPSSGTSSSTNSFGSSSPPGCGNEPPASSPYVFEVDRIGGKATLYFAPVLGENSSYYIGYGRGNNTFEYGVEFPVHRSIGAVSFTIDHLNPLQAYSFIVRGGNGCATGTWSNTVKVPASPWKLKQIFGKR